MPRLVRNTPKLCYHRGTGQAYVNAGGYRQYLGYWPGGPRSTPPKAIQDACASFLAEFISTAAKRPRTNTLGVTIAEVVTQFIQRARGEYRQSNEGTVPKCALIAFVMVYGRNRIAKFGSSKLLDLQQYRVAEGSLTRPGINKCLNRIRQFFKWAAVRELVSGAMRFRAWTRAWQISQE